MEQQQDPAEVWDMLVESARQVASMRASSELSNSLRCPLPLRPGAIRDWLVNKVRLIDQIPPQVREAIRALVAGKANWPLVLCGGPGTGKTCASLCLLDYHLGGGFYFTATGLAQEAACAQMGEIYLPNSGRLLTLSQFWLELGNCQLVVLDELGTRGQVTDHHYDCVQRLLNAREGKPLVCCSNLRLADLATVYDDRIVSRLSAGTVLWLEGADRRPQR
jgi:DNA replication protein DnaC